MLDVDSIKPRPFNGFARSSVHDYLSIQPSRQKHGAKHTNSSRTLAPPAPVGHISDRSALRPCPWDRHVVKEFATKTGVASLAPHDLRRTSARLCRAAGGELEQIQFLLGHVSVQTTERYLGCTQRFAAAVNDKIGIEPPS